MNQESLVGSWLLVSLELTSEQGTLYPLGKNPKGLLIYSAEGHMLATLTAEERPAFSVPDLLLAAPADQARAAATCLSYGGRYELRGDRVLHFVDVSLFPNWVGTVQERIVELDGEKLRLSTPEMTVGGKAQRAFMSWTRARELPGSTRAS